MKNRRPTSQPSDSNSDEEESHVTEETYMILELSAALTRPADFATAAAELTAILRQLYSQRCSKAAQALIVQDVTLAIEACNG